MLLNPWNATRDGERVYNDLSTSDWWIQLQRKVDRDVVILALMLSSDATLVTGNARKKAWPVYLTLGNIPKSIRYQEAYRACRVLAYLPVIPTKSGATKPPWWSKCKTMVFQHCMSLVLRSLTRHTLYYLNGPHGKVYQCLPALATYSADYPEQSLLAGTKSWLCGFGCPRCLAKHKEFHKGPLLSEYCVQKRTPSNMAIYTQNGAMGAMQIEKNAFHISNQDTQWNIYNALVVDDLHQIGGVYKHLLHCVEYLASQQDRRYAIAIQERYQQIPKYRGLKHFSGGFLLKDLTNPTYHELRQHMYQLLPVVHNLIPVQACLCLRAFIDFYTQVSSKEHTQQTLAEADRYLKDFFTYLPIFQDVPGTSLNFPKIHMLTKYTQDIRQRGPIDGYSTMHSERLHKNSAKEPAKRTNGHYRTFTKSLSKFVEDRDAFFDLYPNTIFTEVKCLQA